MPFKVQVLRSSCLREDGLTTLWASVFPEKQDKMMDSQPINQTTLMAICVPDPDLLTITYFFVLSCNLVEVKTKNTEIPIFNLFNIYLK